MQLFDVSACGLLETVSFGLYFRTFLIQGDVILVFFTTPLRKGPKDAVVIRGWGMLLAFFPS